MVDLFFKIFIALFREKIALFRESIALFRDNVGFNMSLCNLSIKQAFLVLDAVDDGLEC